MKMIINFLPKYGYCTWYFEEPDYLTYEPIEIFNTFEQARDYYYKNIKTTIWGIK